MRVRSVCAFGGLLGLVWLQRHACAGVETPDPFELMKRVGVAMRHLRFEGEHLVQLNNERGVTTQRDRVFQDADRLRIEPVKPGTHDKRPIIIVNHGVRQVYHPQQKMVFRYLLKAGQRPIGPFVPLGEGGGLRPQIVAEEEVAQRPTWLVEMRRRDQQLVARLWIDKEKLMPLKREHFGRDGLLANTRSFVSINFQPSFGEDKFELPNVPELQVRTVALHSQSLDALRREVAPHNFKLVGTEGLERLGFKFDGGDVTKDPSNRQLEEVWLRFSKPKGRLSIFQRRESGMSVPDRALNRPGQFMVRRNGWLVTLVGNFKPPELRLFAEALEGPEHAEK